MQNRIKFLKLAFVLIMGSLLITGCPDPEKDPKKTKIIEGEIDDSGPIKTNPRFDGLWEGTAKSSRNKLWTMKITIDSAKKVYKINYLHIKCGGKLILRSMDNKKIEFKEKITYGDCTDNGKIIFTKTNDNEVNAEWYFEGGTKSATGTLKRPIHTDSNALQVYPKYPIISTEGDVQIRTVLSTANGVKESTDENELFVTYKVKDKELVTVTSSGYLIANGPVGKTTVTVTMTDSKKKKLGSRVIEVEVAELDVKKIVLSPNISLLAKGEKQIFSIIGVNGQGPTEVEDEKLSFSYNSNKLDLTSSSNAIVTATAKEKKGYVFLTPTYTEAGSTITGNSAVIEFHTKPNIATPGHVLAGEDANMIRVKNGSIDNLYIAHQREDFKEIILTSFNFKNTNPWSSSTITSSTTNTFLSPKLFILNKTLNLIAIEKKSEKVGNLILLKEESNGAWSDKKVLINDITININSKVELITLNNEVIFTLNEDKKVSIFKVDGSKAKELFSFDTTDAIQSVDLTQNREDELRMVVAQTNKLSYITRQNSKFYIQTVSASTSAKKVKLIYTKKNIPVLLYSTNSGLEKRSMLSDGWSGATKINGTTFNEADFLKNITNFDAVIDRFNNLKITVIDDEELYYIKQYKDRSNKDAWRKTKIVTAHVGANSLSMKMDNKNRITVIYKSFEENWIDYWAEPQFFRYRDKKTKYQNEDDELDENMQDASILRRGNIKPIANAGSDITRTSVQTVTLDASSSSDSDGSIKSYVWSENGTKLGTGKTLSLTTLSVGVHNIELSVIDDRGATVTDTIKVTITRVPGVPIAVITADTKVYENEEFTLDASKSSDSDGSIKSYVWSESGKELGKGKTLKLSNGLTLGKHTIQLTVTDDKGNIDNTVIVINSIFRDAIVGQNLLIENNYGTVTIDTLTIDTKSGKYKTASGCQADLFYTKKEDDSFLFNRTITAGDCTKDCQMKILENASSLQLICGGSVNWTKSLTTQTIIDAIQIIENYANSSTNQTPIVTDYSDAGVTGVDGNNIDAINKLIARTYSAYVNTTTEIQSYVTNVITSHNRIKAYADDNTSSMPSVNDYENFGFKDIITGGNLIGINKFVDATNSTGVDNFSKVEVFVNKVVNGINVIENYANSSTNQTPAIIDYSDAGVTGVDQNNIDAVNKLMARTYSNYVNTTTEIQTYVTKIVTSHNRIKAYADDNTKSQPSVVDYENFGFKNIITGGNLLGINKFVDATNTNGVDSFSKIEILVNKVVDAIKTIENYANSSTNQTPVVTDYSDAGVTGVDQNNIDAVNKLMARTYSNYVNSTTEIQTYIDKVVNAHNKIKAYANDNTKSIPSVNDYENFGFKSIITGGNLIGINIFVDATDSSGVDSFSKIKVLVNKVVDAIEVIANYADSIDNQIPTISDYSDAGVTGVDVNNIDDANQAIADTYSSYANSSTEIQSIVDSL